MTEEDCVFDHERAYREYVRTRKSRARRRLIEIGMATRREDLHHLQPKAPPLLSASEIVEGIKAMEATAFLNSTTAAERKLILERGKKP